jgi:hypothetical protein
MEHCHPAIIKGLWRTSYSDIVKHGILYNGKGLTACSMDSVQLSKSIPLVFLVVV